MTRKWGASGVSGEREPVKIPEDTREEIARDVKRYKREAIPAFFDELIRAIDFYASNKRMADESKPGAVRTNLKNALKAAYSGPR